MESIKLTIAVAIYNIENYLSKCLESLLNQTEKNGYEILLINDGSTDNSREICEKYIRKGLKAKIIDKENGGLTSVRNLSIDLAKGERILFLDGDDYIEKETIEIIFKEMEDYDLLVFGFNWISENEIYKDERFVKNKIYDNKEKIDNLIFRKEINPAVWNKIFKLDILRNNKLYFMDFKTSEDTPFILLYLKYCTNIKILKKYLYNYLYRENSLANNKNKDFYKNHLNFYLWVLNEEKIKTKFLNNYILEEYVYLLREIAKKKKYILIEQKELQGICNEIENKLKIIKIIFDKNISFKFKLRYLKIRIKKLCQS